MVNSNRLKQERLGTSSSDDKSSHVLSTETCIYIQTSLIGGLMIFAAIRSFAFYSICIRSSRRIHSMMFKGIISTSMRFFDTNPSGRILNRFSKDLGLVDDILPRVLHEGAIHILSMLGFLVVVAFVNPYFLVPVSIMIIIFLLIRKIFMVTTPDLRQLDGICKQITFYAALFYSIVFMDWTNLIICSKITFVHTFAGYHEWHFHNSR